MIDRILDAGGMFDLFTPLWTLIQDILHGSAVAFNVPVDSGLAAWDIRDMLKDSGVKVWGLTILGHDIHFHTTKGQAFYTQYLLERAEVPYWGGVSRRERYRHARATRGTARRGSMRDARRPNVEIESRRHVFGKKEAGAGDPQVEGWLSSTLNEVRRALDPDS